MSEQSPLPERYESPRLLIRRWTVEDLDPLAAAVDRNVDHLRPWMPWIADEPLPRAGRAALLGRWQREWEAGGDVVLGILLDGVVVGGTGFHRRRGPHGLEIGYWLDKDHLGRGIATEATSVLTTAALSLDGITFVQIHHDKANRRSAAVPRRLGYRYLGESPEPPKAPAEVGIDCTWQVTRENWPGRGDGADRPVGAP